MEVRTTRFGTIEIREDRVITFPKGLLGFGNNRRFCLLEPSEDACFFWLQSLDEPALAFVITDPSLFAPEYAVPIRAEQMDELCLGKLEDAQVFVIVNKVDETLTGNLQGPLVINTLTRTGEQLVLAEKKWTTRHPLVNVAAQVRTTSQPRAIPA
ncbi:MAG: flagellar assembly protein FliW [Planctomycetes bacterium]|nr:flagellar assembly protein FliW [Planctomycetota bacterium]